MIIDSQERTLRSELPLFQPEPILNQLPESAFTAERYTARLYINGIQTPIRSFQYLRSRNTIGATLNITLAYPHQNQISNNPIIKFELRKYTAGNWSIWTLVDNSLINSKSYTLSFEGDSLSFSTQSLLSDKLSASPKQNVIAFSSSKIDVNIDEIEPLPVVGGGLIPTQARPFQILTLYNLLSMAFVEGCGFSAFKTNIPNFEVLRCDFDITSTYLNAVAGIIGVFEPLPFAVGNELWLLDKTQPIPSEFSPRVLGKAKITNLTAQTQNRQITDGYQIEYLSNTANGTTSTETKTSIKDFGSFTIETTETIKYWKDADGAILKQETISKRIDTKADFTFASKTIENTFDGQGKLTLALESHQVRVPDMNSYPNRNLAEVAEKRVEYIYGTDPRSFRRVVPREIITREKKLVVVDSDNKYLETDFTQDIQEADKAGNITEGMTTQFTETKTKIERFITKRNGQIEREYTVIDHLRGSVPDDESDTRSGDISINGELSEQRSIIILRDGVTFENRKNPIQPFPIGEVPLQFGKELARRKLVQQFKQLFDASIEVPGFDENLEVGVYFAVPDRNGILGNFLTEGFTISGDAQNGIRTTITAAQI